MLVVMALVWLFIVATNFLTRDVRIAQTNSEKFANTIEDTIKNARNGMVVGRWVYTWGTLFKAEKRIVSITASGISASYQYNGTNTGSESSTQWPFFDNDANYQITDISVSSGRLTDIASMQWDYTGVENTDIVMLPNWDISITAIKWGTIIPANEINSLRITAGYAGMERSVILDRFIGNTEVIKWRDGITAAYVAPPPAPVAVNGACNGIVKFTCDAGTVTNQSNGSCGGQATWTCTGTDGGTDAACSIANWGCSVNGVCDNTTKFACTSGTSINNTTGACGTTDTWNCDWIDWWTTSGLCSKASDPCNTSGVCGGTANTCTAGTPSGYSTGSCGWSQTWSCDGSWTGSTAACSITNPACINGACNAPFNSATTPTPTCATGTPTAISGTGPWTWWCNSTNGWTNTASNACTANKIVDCVGSWSNNTVPYCSASCGWWNLQQTYTITTPAANGWAACETYNGDTRWWPSSCNTAACSTPAYVTAWSACSGGTQSRTCTEQTGWDPITCASLGATPGVNNQSCGNNGTCDNNTQFACSSGNSVSNVTNYTGASCGGTSTWWCDGVSGGTSTTATACSKVNPLCAVNGVCGGLSNTCTAGTASWYLAGSCGGSQTWSCVGANGWSTAACNIANTPCPQVVSCGWSIPANATASTATTYTQTWNWSAWTPTTSWAESQATCDFNCNSNYTWNGSSCVANTQTYTCAAKPATGTSWNSVSSYTQTWNWSAWSPAGTSTTYNTTASSTACNYICATNYTWNGSSCVANTQSATCGWSIPANATASTATTYTQTWNWSAWTPTTSWAESQATCDFNCNSNYTWNGSSCVANTWVTGVYGSCSVSCGWGGTQTRTVVCQQYNGVTVPDAFCGWTKPATSQACWASPCPIDCYWTWSAYGACNTTCGTGTKSRTFTQTVAAQYGWASCTSIYGVENGGTSTTSCTDTSGTTDWYDVSSCSTVCGTGTKSQSNSCGWSRSVSCTDTSGTTQWWAYGSCDTICWTGTKTRYNACGWSQSTSCTDTSGTTQWSDSSSCSTICGTGTKSQTNTCGWTRSVSCTDTSGNSQWWSYGSCSTICGTGTMTRTNACGGTSSASCTDTSGNSQWGGWSACSASCGPGTQTRTNSCGWTQSQWCNNGSCAPPPPVCGSTDWSCNSGNAADGWDGGCGSQKTWTCGNGVTTVNCSKNNPACSYVSWSWGCFVPGTQVTMASGITKSIEKVLVWELVRTYDESTKKFIDRPVSSIQHHDAKIQTLYTFVYWDNTVTSNSIHRYYLPVEDKYYSAEDIYKKWKNGEKVLLLDGIKNIWVPITNIGIDEKNTPVYNLHVDGIHDDNGMCDKYRSNHNYIANGLVVHNYKMDSSMEDYDLFVNYCAAMVQTDVCDPHSPTFSNNYTLSCWWTTEQRTNFYNCMP